MIIFYISCLHSANAFFHFPFCLSYLLLFFYVKNSFKNYLKYPRRERSGNLLQTTWYFCDLLRNEDLRKKSNDKSQKTLLHKNNNNT